MAEGTEKLTLKWGTLKGWKVNEGSKAARLMERYFEEGVSLGAMTQRDTDSQKQLILEIIDAVDCDQVYLDWDGRYVSKDEAKRYVSEYSS